MVNIKAKISGHQQLCVLLLRLAAHCDERDLLPDIGQRVRNGFTGLNIDRSNNVRAGNIRLAILPDDVVLILEPVLEFLVAAVHCDCAPVIASRIIVVFHSDRAAAQLVATELRQQLRDNILPCLFCLTHALAGFVAFAECTRDNGIARILAVERHTGLTCQTISRDADELADVLDHARLEISKADIMQKELIANVSHDFKTPLTMIKAYASMIREISGDNKKKRDANAKVIIDECDRLTMLVSDLLDLSKLRAGMNSEEKRTVFNLSEEVCAVAGRFSYLSETEGYDIETQIEDGLYIRANKERIAQVFYNLIGNAVNYTGEDKRVRVKLFRKGANARFEVIDSGKGIPADEVDTIWDRYYRSGASHKRPVSGTGLGLSIVKNILLQHDCPFGVISEQGKGSCFWAEFPLPSDEAEDGERRGENRGKEDVRKAE